MAELVVRVELTASFLDRLAAIETFLTEADAGAAYDRLLDELRTTVVPNLRRFPRIGSPPKHSRSWPHCRPAQPTVCASTCTATT